MPCLLAVSWLALQSSNRSKTCFDANIYLNYLLQLTNSLPSGHIQCCFRLKPNPNLATQWLKMDAHGDWWWCVWVDVYIRRCGGDGCLDFIRPKKIVLIWLTLILSKVRICIILTAQISIPKNSISLQCTCNSLPPESAKSSKSYSDLEPWKKKWNFGL